jgi:hypothetical protein
MCARTRAQGRARVTTNSQELTPLAAQRRRVSRLVHARTQLMKQCYCVHRSQPCRTRVGQVPAAEGNQVAVPLGHGRGGAGGLEAAGRDERALVRLRVAWRQHKLRFQALGARALGGAWRQRALARAHGKWAQARACQARGAKRAARAHFKDGLRASQSRGANRTDTATTRIPTAAEGQCPPEQGQGTEQEQRARVRELRVWDAAPRGLALCVSAFRPTLACSATMPYGPFG